MKVTQRTIGDRDCYLAADEAQRVMDSAAGARERGEWLELRGARGGLVHLLIPTEALVVIHQYEVDDDPDDDAENSNEWIAFDLDL